MVDASMNKGGNSQPEAMFSVRYHKYRFESCPDYSIVFYFLIMQIGAREGIFCLVTADLDVIFII